MRQLNDNEKTDIKKMLESRWFKIMEWLVAEYKVDVMNEMLTLPLWEQVTIDKLTWKQNYLKWITEFIQRVKSSKSWVWRKIEKKED